MRTEWTPEQVSATEPDGPDFDCDACGARAGEPCVTPYGDGMLVKRDAPHESRQPDSQDLERLRILLEGVAEIDAEISAMQTSDRDLERRTR
jgi:hypothetical protein